jgi:thiol-disulfide isomerase/thioredoxin
LKDKILGTFALIMAAGLIYFFATPTYREGEASLAGRKAIDFPLQYEGRQVHLSDLHGKVVVLNFWASWCPPCLEETPSLNKLQQQIASKGGVVLGVSVDEDGPLCFPPIATQPVRLPRNTVPRCIRRAI